MLTSRGALLSGSTPPITATHGPANFSTESAGS
jgi:hypothetical protein